MSLKIKNYLLYLILCLILRNCECFQESLFLNRTADEYYCGPPFIIQHSKQVVFFISDYNNLDTFLKDCLLGKRSIGLSVMYLNDNEYMHAIPNKKRIEYTNFKPIIVVVIHDLNMEIVYHPTTKSIFKSHRSIVYVVITTRNATYGCKEGVFNDKVFKTIDLFLNRIWHKYQMFNVIVEFPFVCPDYYVIYNDKRPSGLELYDRTITTISANSSEISEKFKKDWFNLMQGYPLRVNIFQRFPYSIFECQNMHYYLKVDEKYTNGMCGMDAFVMHDVLRFYQFNTTFPEITDIDGYGFEYNNTITGSLGQLLRNEFDVSFNSRFMVKYLDEDKIHFLHFISFDSICAVLKIPDNMPLWYYSYNFLQPSTWAALLSMLTLCSATNKIFERIRRSMGKEPNSSNIIELISIGVFAWYYNKRLKSSILGGVCLLISIVICALFQGHVNYVYTTLVRYSRIRTLDELHNTNTQIHTSKSFYKLLGSDVQSHVILNGNKHTGDVLTESHIATLQRKSDVILEIRRDLHDEAGWPMVYLVHECYCNLFLSYITRKGFPFTNEIKVSMMLLLESGLPDAYYRFTQNALDLAPTKNFYKPTSMPRPFTSSNMLEFSIAFSFLCVGFIVSTITLVIERWWAKRSKRVDKTPNEALRFGVRNIFAWSIRPIRVCSPEHVTKHKL